MWCLSNYEIANAPARKHRFTLNHYTLSLDQRLARWPGHPTPCTVVVRLKVEKTRRPCSDGSIFSSILEKFSINRKRFLN
jgi:hypothetical protein